MVAIFSTPSIDIVKALLTPNSPPKTGKAQTKYLRRAVTIRKLPSYSAGYNHVYPNGKAKAVRPSPVRFLGNAGNNGGWSRISYTYGGKSHIGYIHNGNFSDDVNWENYSKSNYWDASMLPAYSAAPATTGDTDYSSDSTGGGGVSEAQDSAAPTSVSAITSSSNTAVPTHLAKFTNPANSLGASYPVFSPNPDPNAENELISSKSQYEEPFNIFVLPGYTPARMTIYTYVDKKQVARSFEFLIGPSNMTESNTNSVIPLKTGAGFFLLRNGAELGRLNISGYLLESDAVDERRLFMENYYRSYMIDKVNTFHSYFNESSLYLELEGYRYQCILQNLDLAKAVDSMFLFRYSMNLLVLSQEPIGGVKKPGAVTSRPKQSPVRTEMVRGAGVVLGAAAALASMMTVRR